MTPIETRKPARRWSGGIIVDWPTGAVAREPAHPLLVEQLEVGGVAQRPVRPDDLVERAARPPRGGLEVREALAGVLLDPAADDLRSSRDRSGRRTRRRPCRRRSTALPDAERQDARRRRVVRVLEPEPALHATRVGLSGSSGGMPNSPCGSSMPCACELGHERRPDAGRRELADDLAVDDVASARRRRCPGSGSRRPRSRRPR